MNAFQLKDKLAEILKEQDVSGYEFATGEMEEETFAAIKEACGEFELIVEAERTEGGGDFDGAQSVYHFTSHDVYIAIDGSYDSDNGFDFEDDDIYAAFPKEITKTVYYKLQLSAVKNNSSQAW